MVVTLDIKEETMERALEALATSIARLTEEGEQHITAIPGLSLYRREERTEPMTGMYEPSICLVARGPSGCCSVMRRLSTMHTTT